MPSRLRRRSSVVRQNSYDSSAVLYFAAAGITNSVEKSAANTFIVGMKAAGLWDKCDRIYLRSPTSLAAALMCCKTLLSQTNVNSATHSSSGITFNGTTQYLRTGDTLVSGMSKVALNSAHISVYFDPNSISIGTTIAGCEQDNFPTTDDGFYLRNGGLS